MPSLSERLQAARNRRPQAERPIDPSVVAAQPVGTGASSPPRGRRASAAEPDAVRPDSSEPIAEAEHAAEPAVASEGAEHDWTPEWDSAEGPGWGSAAEPEPSWLAEAREDAGAGAPASDAAVSEAPTGQPPRTADPEIERILAGHDATELVDPALVSPQPVQPVVLNASAPSMPPVEDLYDGAALAVIPRSDDGGGGDEVQRVREEASDLFAERIGTRLNDPGLSEGDLDTMARRELASIIDERGQSLSERERFALIQELADEVLGLGPIEPLLDDESVSEVMVNGHDHIYVERRGRIQRVPTGFRSEERLRRVIERIVTRVGRRIDESSPLVDARLADGSRVNAVIPPLAIGGSSLTIRKFAAEPLRARDLVSLGTVSDDMVQLLIACVRARLNVIVSGGTGTGKTTLLNVLSSFIPHDERIITIEDAAELQLQQEHVVRLESRPANLEGRGEVTIRDLVRNALRMRPDRIVVGESRGGESLDMLQAMSTGHDGSLTTLHANSPRDAIARLETLVMMAGMELPHRAIREQIASAVDVIIQVTRLRDGTRRVTHVSEVLGMENDIVTLQDVYRFDFAAGVDHSGRFLGKAQPTGIRPRFLTRFDELGVPFDASLFTTAADRADWA
jgi:pilus assembly protein CpaF